MVGDLLRCCIRVRPSLPTARHGVRRSIVLTDHATVPGRAPTLAGTSTSAKSGKIMGPEGVTFGARMM
jgi:hypothetical protein